MVCFQYYILCGHIGVFVLGREEGKGGRKGRVGGREGGRGDGGRDGGRTEREGKEGGGREGGPPLTPIPECWSKSRSSWR